MCGLWYAVHHHTKYSLPVVFAYFYSEEVLDVSDILRCCLIQIFAVVFLIGIVDSVTV